MNGREAIYCNRCNRLIVFIRTEKGKPMPCEASTVPYLADERGDRQILTDRGKLVRCRILAPEDKGDCTGFGYVPHFASCLSRGSRERMEAYKRQGGSGIGRGASVEKASTKPTTPIAPEYEQLSLFAPVARQYRYPG